MDGDGQSAVSDMSWQLRNRNDLYRIENDVKCAKCCEHGTSEKQHYDEKSTLIQVLIDKLI